MPERVVPGALRGAVAALALGLILAGCSTPRITVTIGRPGSAPTPAPGASSPATPAQPQPAASVQPVDAATTADRWVSPPNVPAGARTAVTLAALRSAPASELRIPSIGLAVPVQDVASTVVGGQWTWPIPLAAAGHHLGTANPGEPGNIVISGHVNTRTGAGVFARLGDVRTGDTIEVDSAVGRFTYRVQSLTVVPQTDVTPLLQVPHEQLTLITCVPDGVYRTRLVIRASRV